MAKECASLKLHRSSVTCCAFSPQDDVLCSGSLDLTLMLWRLSDGWSHRLRGHSGWVTCCSFNRQGSLLASGSADETLRLWDVEKMLREEAEESDGEHSLLLKGYGGSIRCCSFNSSGRVLCSGSTDETVRIWRVKDGKCVKVLREHAGWVLCCCFSPSSASLLVSGAADGGVCIWDIKIPEPCLKHIKSKKSMRSLRSSEVTCCAFHPDGKVFCVGGEDKQLRLLRVEDGEVVELLRCQQSVTGCAFQPGAKRREEEEEEAGGRRDCA
ncbi:hypothetical protein GUITHDRAFT_148428 [Guillardia theta CCMP2712]|uniref:Anaphase-promoting complex subunit 4-like WD40 domain-containing protein n=1 Tax=Guillardia theta (strain CCMP2712) TaxID=905079 RepID=L1I9Z1_GUITC|nr:hypothetical protein GUITHDRAFT_148428 [Guillardia theta CCMP2712]EKX32714.1 hypothetical protein GUITHDRAFT_148428 [Guillardia theta CCMP2712]|eukprot:XP_005819694.1 hypothetical protein GUITHDRAFT_148428 [Guillardia theta CCMP2712]